jgi:hypothetical protein
VLPPENATGTLPYWRSSSMSLSRTLRTGPTSPLDPSV